METTVQPPTVIAEIIERKRQALLEERRQKEDAQRLELEALETEGKAQFDTYIQESISKCLNTSGPTTTLSGIPRTTCGLVGDGIV